MKSCQPIDGSSKRSSGDEVYENYARILRARLRHFGRPRSRYVTVHDVVQASVFRLYASAGESGLVRARTGCDQAAYLCGLSYPYGRVWTFVFSLVMRRGQRFESARRLSIRY
jgi:hypothetical protein